MSARTMTAWAVPLAATLVLVGCGAAPSNQLPSPAHVPETIADSAGAAAASTDAAADSADAIANVQRRDQVLSAPLPDCNTNGVPDACELDCGASGGPCDVPGCGTAADCNADGVLDECNLAGGGEVAVWASHVIAFSSQFNAFNWSAEDALGPPNTFAYGDLPTAWAPRTRNGTRELLTLGFDVPMRATAVTVRETLGNGFVFQIDVLDTAGAAHTVWTGADPSMPGAPAELHVEFAATDFLVAGVAVHVDTDHNAATFEEIDAVALHGLRPDGADCNTNGIPDECEADADGNGVPDECDPNGLPLWDCNGNGVDDDFDLAGGTAADCNSNGVPDSCDIAAESSADCNGNGLPDECEPCCRHCDEWRGHDGGDHHRKGHGRGRDQGRGHGRGNHRDGGDCDGEDGGEGDGDCLSCGDCAPPETIVLAGCDTGVPNQQIGDDGGTMADQLGECAATARTHGAFVSCVTHLTNAWKRQGLITGSEKGRVQRCAARASRP